MSFIRDEKGQAPLGVLLMVIAAVLIATIVGVYLKREAVEQTGEAEKDLNNIKNALE